MFLDTIVTVFSDFLSGPPVPIARHLRPLLPLRILVHLHRDAEAGANQEDHNYGGRVDIWRGKTLQIQLELHLAPFKQVENN
jgi:hypothetical protein